MIKSSFFALIKSVVHENFWNFRNIIILIMPHYSKMQIRKIFYNNEALYQNQKHGVNYIQASSNKISASSYM